MNPVAYCDRYGADSGNVMVRSSYLNKGELERSKERERDWEAVKIKIGAEDRLIDSMVYKVKKYLAITEAMLKNPTKI